MRSPIIKELEEQVEILSSRKKYGLVYEEQPEEVEGICKTKIPVLKAQPSLNVNNGGQEHLLIEGDNLHTLMALQLTHKGKVDVIYIDPPYNTGNKDFVYNDRYVDSEDTWRHSKWLSFMAKRLRLARELLSDSGVIFVSIDDNEQAQLKLLMDEVFGEKNFVANLIWHRGGGNSNDAGRNITIITEYVLCYANTGFSFNLAPKDLSKFQNKLSFDNLAYFESERAGSFQLINLNKQKDYEVNIKLKDGSFIKNYPSMCPQKRVDEWQKEGKIVVNSKGVVYYKSFIEDEKKGKNQNNILTGLGTTKGAGRHLNLMVRLDLKKMYPKPVELIKYLIQISTKNHNATILDFFAGSGTTGQAVLELNREDGGNRQFVLATNNENNICRDVCYERIRRLLAGECADGRQAEEGTLRFFTNDFVVGG